MAEAAIEERQLLKSLRWYDGFVIALCNPGFLIGFVGFSFGTLGAWGAMALWGISAVIGFMQNWIYSETAAMFPEQSGGISLYAHEGWRRYFSLVGPVATFGYWIGWSVVLSIFGKLIGDLIVSKWFPGSAAARLLLAREQPSRSGSHDRDRADHRLSGPSTSSASSRRSGSATSPGRC